MERVLAVDANDRTKPPQKDEKIFTDNKAGSDNSSISPRKRLDGEMVCYCHIANYKQTRLLEEAHQSRLHKFLAVHRTEAGAFVELSTGIFGVLIPGAGGYLRNLSLACTTCRWSKTTPWP